MGLRKWVADQAIKNDDFLQYAEQRMLEDQFDTKSSGIPNFLGDIPLGRLLQDFPDSAALFGSPSYTTISRDGYKLNYVIHKIIDDISRMGSNIPLTIEASKNIQDLMMMPTPGVPYTKWMKRAIAEKFLDGNAYAGITLIGKTITRLDQFRPDRVTIETTTAGGLCERIFRYLHNCGGIREFLVDPDTGVAEIFHTKFYNPLDENRGLSPVIAAFKSLTQNNEISRIHTATLKNDGAVKGFLNLKKPTKDGLAAAPGKEDMKGIRKEVNDILSGVKNRGKWAIFNWLFEFTRMGQTGAEMDWNKNKELTAREMAIALGYPAELLGFSEGATFNNIAAAQRWLMIHTVIPVLEEILADLSMAIFMHTGEMPVIEPNREEILAIQEIIREKREAAGKDFDRGVITLEETRKEGGYPEKIEGTLFINAGRLPINIDGNDFDLPPTNEGDS